MHLVELLMQYKFLDIMNNKKIHFSASLACADFKNLGLEIMELEKAGIDFFHFDICDGHFAPTFLLSPVIIKSLRSVSNLRFDAHLYCNYPSRYIDELICSGIDMIIVHIESMEDYRILIKEINKKGINVGLAILPNTKMPEDIVDILPFISLFIINMVGPAYAGQTFNAGGIKNLKKIVDIKENSIQTSNRLEFEIGADGGVNLNNIDIIFESGANHLILGSTSIFNKDKNYKRKIKLLRNHMDIISSRG